MGIVKLLILYIYIYIKSKLGHVNIFSNFWHKFFDNSIVTASGGGNLKPYSPYQGDQSMPLSYKPFGNFQHNWINNERNSKTE